MKTLLVIIRSRQIAPAAAKIALVVGTVLNMINQGAAIWAGEPIAWGRLLLNYVVPFCVASYSAARNELRK